MAHMHFIIKPHVVVALNGTLSLIMVSKNIFYSLQNLEVAKIFKQNSVISLYMITVYTRL